MPKFHDKTFPGESSEYRQQRDALLRAEMDLRNRIEEVARLRRNLPLGGPLKEDYVFEEGPADLAQSGKVRAVRLSELFQEGKNALMVYSFMFAPGAEKPCPMCTSILDGLNGQARHFLERVNFVAVAKAPIDSFREWGRQRGWSDLRLLSSAKNSYNRDYFGESLDGDQWPALNVFSKKEGKIHHYYAAELLYAPTEEGQNARHVDLIWPLWNLFDLTPEGRGSDWYPRHTYNGSG